MEPVIAWNKTVTGVLVIKASAIRSCIQRLWAVDSMLD